MRIATVLVTYNRLSLLKKTLKTYEAQFFLPTIIIVVNNCSTDGTGEYLNEWKEIESKYEKVVINTERNIGGSGGFYIGLQYAEQLNLDWIWIADDDAFLENNTLNILKLFVEEHKELMTDCVALCSSVVTDQVSNKIDVGHRRHMTVKCGIPVMANCGLDEYKAEYFKVDLFTYVGTLVNLSILKKVGLPEKDFFIYFDDLEHSYRFRKEGMMYCVPKSRVYHNAENNISPGYITWRDYYRLRNYLYTLKKHFKVAFVWQVIKKNIKHMIFCFDKNKKPLFELEKDAIHYAKQNTLGINEKYFIGWSQKVER